MGIERAAVVIPTFNRASMIDTAIRSVRGAAVYVYDDGSTDDTQGVIAGGDYDVEIVYERGEHEGMTVAFNRAVAMVPTDTTYLAFLGSDDCYHPDKIARQIAYLDEHEDCDCVFTGMAFATGGSRRWKQMMAGEYRGAHKTIAIDEYDAQNFRSFQRNVLTGSAMLHRCLWLPWHEEIRTGGADLLWVYEMFCQGLTFGYIDEALYYTRLHGGRELERRRAMDQGVVRAELDEHYWPLVHRIAEEAI